MSKAALDLVPVLTLKNPFPAGGEPSRQLLCLLGVRAEAAAPAPRLLPCHQQHGCVSLGAAAEVGVAQRDQGAAGLGVWVASSAGCPHQVPREATALPASLRHLSLRDGAQCGHSRGPEGVSGSILVLPPLAPARVCCPQPLNLTLAFNPLCCFTGCCYSGATGSGTTSS